MSFHDMTVARADDRIICYDWTGFNVGSDHTHTIVIRPSIS